MTVLEVNTYGHPMLRKQCAEVVDFNPLPNLIDNMVATMYETEGIGLAANQVGFDLNLMVVDISTTDETESLRVFINGEILNGSGESLMEEGCLSLPEVRFDVKRYETILFKYQAVDKATHTATFKGLLARVIQHERDHLKGMLIIDRVSPLVRLQFNKKLKEIAENSLAVAPSSGNQIIL